MHQSEKIQQCIDALCTSGCEAVRATIKALELELPVAQLDGMDARERAAVLSELKAIMAVYDR